MDERDLKFFSGDDMAEAIGDLALRAMLCEVAATPKPGLVDRANNGAHTDMDFYAFMSSAASLRSSFEEFARIGIAARGLTPREAFLPLRREGVRAEKKMFAATGGVNTHKGAIFSLGLLCGAAGRTSSQGRISADEICRTAAEMCAGICDEAYVSLEKKKNPTKGERAFLKYGLRGVRGEAEDGFPSVLAISLPAYRDIKKSGAPLNDSLVHALICLMAHVHDTNVIMRHNMEAAAYVRQRAGEAIARGGMTAPEGRRAILEMDADFIARNISPGGCADLLALTYFLDSLDEMGSR